MLVNSTRGERATLLLTFGFILLGLALGSLITYAGPSSTRLSPSGPDVVTPIVLFSVGAVLVAAGLFVRRGRPP